MKFFLSLLIGPSSFASCLNDTRLTRKGNPCCFFQYEQWRWQLHACSMPCFHFLHEDRSKMISFILMVNKQGQTRLSSYYQWMPMEERVALESEIIRKCLSRSELQCSFLEYRGFKVIYRRYASLFFIVGTKADIDAGKGAENNENEMGMLEFIHTLVETMDKWAGSICELDIMYQLEEVHFLLDEMVMNGYIVETNKTNILRPIDLLEREAKTAEGMFR